MIQQPLLAARTRSGPRRLPGFRFEAQPPPLDDVLPRMDIAAFVGFAASGPLHTPVVVEDPGRFAELFEANDVGELPLAWDAERGEWAYAYLGPAVRAFLRNGGRRCWVVRVADAGKAETSRFLLPGILQVEGSSGSPLRPASVAARSPGSWADGLRVGVGLTSTAIVLTSMEMRAGTPGDALGEATTSMAAVQSAGQINPGDLLRLEFTGEELVGYLGVSSSSMVEDALGVTRTVASGQVVWFRRVAPEDLAAVASGDGGPAASWWGGAGPGPLTLPALDLRLSDPSGSTPGVLSFRLEAPPAGRFAPPAQEGLVRIAMDGVEMWMLAERVVEDAAGAVNWIVSGRAMMRVTPPPALSRTVAPLPLDPFRDRVARTSAGLGLGPAAMSAPTPDRCEWLRLDVTATQGMRDPWRVANLDFGPQGARYWGALPSDEALFELQPDPSEARDARAGLWRDATAPRFPLAGDAAVAGANPGPGAAGTGPSDGFSFPFIPFSGGFPLFGSQGEGQATALNSGAPALQRDGLSRFGSDLFLDPALAGNTAADLLNHADDIRYIAPQTRPLRGIHAVLAVDEVTLVAAPDAVQRPWQQGEGPALEAPQPSPPPERPDWRPHPCQEDQEDQANQGQFLAATIRVIEPPTWAAGDPVAGAVIRLVWQPSGSGALRFRVEEATLSDFADARAIYEGTNEALTLYGRSAGDYFYRVRATDAIGNFSNWSDGLPVRVGPPAGFVLKPFFSSPGVPSPAAAEQRTLLLQVQRGLLRMCAARGDLFAILTLPEHLVEDDAIAYVSLLAPSADPVFDPGAPLLDLPLGFGEAYALTYGAVYHPWLIEQVPLANAGGRGPVPADSQFLISSSSRQTGPGALRRVPPDGAMCGLLAARASSRGAWVAPANQTLTGIVALTPPLARSRWLDLQEAQVNVVRQEPTGFMTLSADTLSWDPEWLQINVRRLIQLLRRMVQRMGPGFVFEPQGDAFQRMVRREIEAVLRVLFERGAFAGDTPETSYQVVVRTTPQDLDNGRFIVEIKVAPSLPMVFMTVRLVQTGGRATVTEER